MQTKSKKRTLYSARTENGQSIILNRHGIDDTIVSRNSHFSAKNMKSADEGYTDQSDKLQESIVKLFRGRVECGDNIFGKDEAIWRGVSDDDKKEGEYATHQILRSRVCFLQLKDDEREMTWYQSLFCCVLHI